MNSLGLYPSAGVCHLVHIGAKEVVDGRMSLPEQLISSSPVGVTGDRVVRLQADAPHLVKGLALAKILLLVPKR